MIRENLPALVVVVPLLVALCTMGLGWFRPRLAQPLALAGIALSGAAAILLLGRVVAAGGSGLVRYWFGGWVPAEGVEPFGIEYAVDGLNAVMAVVVAVIAFLATLYAGRPVARECPGKEPHIYTLYLLQYTGLVGIVLTGDAFNLYVLLEIASISGYALIAMGRGAAPLAAFKYLMVGSMGACWYLLGVGYLYIHTGTLNMHLLLEFIQGAVRGGECHPSLVTAFAFCAVGLGIKIAIFPLHWWLPAAYARAPDAVSVLLAPLSTKVAVYALLRLVLSVFGLEFFLNAAVGSLPHLLTGIGTAAILYGSFLALRQRELKRMLAFIVVAEMGYFVGGLGLANPSGLTGAMLHLANDALMTTCLFMVAGSVAHTLGVRRIQGLGGLFQRMPLTGAALVLGGLSVIGIPPTCGFFSKWYLILGALEAQQYHFLGALLCASVVAAVLFFRLFEVAVFRPPDAPTPAEEPPRTEAPLSMLVPQLLCALALLGAGLATSLLVGWLRLAIPG